MELVNSLLAFLFPPRESALLIKALPVEDMHLRYEPVRHEDAVSLASFRDPIIRACIHEIKFHNNERGAVLLASLLNTWIECEITAPTLILPMPVSAKRYRERGYNQVARVAKHVCSARTNLTLTPNLLVRVRNTAPQTSLDREARLKNTEGAFAVSGNRAKHMIRNAHILLLDDVYTTGATIRAAKAALLSHHPASVTCVALAH